MYSRCGFQATLAVIAILLLVSIGCGKEEPRTEGAREGEAGAIETKIDASVVAGKEETQAAPDTTELSMEELLYDDGEIDQRNSPWSEQAGGQVAVAFTPSSYPVTIQKVSFFIGSNGIPTKTFRVRIYDGDRETGPVEEDLLEVEIVAVASYANQWVKIDLHEHGINIPEGDFFVAMEWLTPPGNYGTRAQMLGSDSSGPDRRSWWKHYPDSDWVRIEEISDSGDRDLMIRATVTEAR